jgi:hypothetical protein
LGHTLKPRTAVPLSAKEVAISLRQAFPFVQVNAEDGLRQAHARADWIDKMPPAVSLGRHREALEFAARLRKLPIGDALSIVFGDDLLRSVKIVVLPEELIQFSYRDKEDEIEKRDLVERCARALDCDVVLF